MAEAPIGALPAPEAMAVIRPVISKTPPTSPTSAATSPATSLRRGAPRSTAVDLYLSAAVDAAHTRRAYRRHLAAAGEALGFPQLDELAGTDLAHYRAAILADGRGPASHSQALAALRAFLAWVGTFGAHQLAAGVLAAALRSPRADVRRPYTVLSPAELAALLAAAPTLRDRALLSVLLGSGLRVGEAAALDVADLIEDDQGAALLAVRSGKATAAARCRSAPSWRRYCAATSPRRAAVSARPGRSSAPTTAAPRPGPGAG